MCQLTFVNLGTKKRNTFWLINQLLINTLESHQDGAGVYDIGTNNPASVWKTKHPPYNIENLANCIDSAIISNSPVMAHVRLATLKFSSEEFITPEKAHPFLSPCKEFMLAHNGTLSYRDYTKIADNKKIDDGLIDTEVFIRELSENYKKHRVMVLALKKTMEEFRGKFAFIIHSFREKKTFIIRGSTAELFKTTILIDQKEVGWIVNTEAESLERAMKFFEQNWFNSNKQRINFKKLDEKGALIEELDEETIYVVKDNNLISIASIEENDTVYPRVFPVVRIRNEDNKSLIDTSKLGGAFINSEIKGSSKNAVKDYKNPIYNTTTTNDVIESIIKWSNVNNMTLLEIDYLYSLAYSTGLAGSSMKELQEFINIVLPEFAKENTKPKRKSGWNKLIKKHNFSENLYIYVANKELLFPWMLNSLKDLQKALRKTLPNKEKLSVDLEKLEKE